jgi:fructoselysine 6-kinase
MRVSAVCVGDNCVDYYLPPLNHRYIGGNAVNVAVYLKRSGVPSAYVGVVGDDLDGRLTLEKLTGEGVDVSHVRMVPGKTATTHIRLAASGDRQFVYEYLGPRQTLEIDETALEFISRHSVVHNTMSGGTEPYLPNFRRMAGLTVSIDYGERSHPDFVTRTLPYVDVAFFSMNPEQRGEAEALARDKHATGLRLVVVTLGIGGSLAFDGNLYYQAAVPVKVVDTLGAGDAYIGTFLAYWLRGRGVAACMENASLAAAEACTHFGGWSQPENPSITADLGKPEKSSSREK